MPVPLCAHTHQHTLKIQTNAQYLLHDSRQLMFPEASIFFAIQGQHHDGHDYVPPLYEQGVREFVVEEGAFSETQKQAFERLENAKFWVVDNALRAMQQLVADHRAQFHVPVVGITGSNGKTIVKEWLAQLLAPEFNVVKSPKSYNSQLGVPLSVWAMNANHTLGIFEAGLSKPHEIEHIEPVVRPTIGIFTNIGPAHDEGFRSTKQKITEKLRLFSHAQKLIYCADYEDIDTEVNIILRAANPTIDLVAWGKKKSARAKYQTLFDAVAQKLTVNDHVFSTHFKDAASVENLTHCIVLMLEMKYAPALIEQRIALLRPVSMRLEMKQGTNNCYLIDDSYNNDLAGLTMALQFLSQQEQRPQKVVILSDLLQTGQKEPDLYQHIAQLLAEKKVDRLVGIGAAFGRNSAFFQAGSLFFPDTEAFMAAALVFKNSLILVKGARPFEFERIVNQLQEKVHGTVLEINLDALTHNLNYYREKAGANTKIMVMVKAFAYGSGSAEVAQLLQFHRVDYLAVAYADEGIELRQNGIELPIMVMNPAAGSFEKMFEHNLEPEIYSPRILEHWLAFVAQKKGKKTPEIHLKLDTGMHRLGFVESDLPTLIAQITENPVLRVATVFSHLVGADESQHNAFSEKQFALFGAMYSRITAALGYQPARHILNSAGIVRFPDFKMDMVRLGIGLYGVEVNQLEQRFLRPIGTLKTVISQIKNLEVGQTVGYGRRGVLERDARIATIAIGYADGFDRGFSGAVGRVSVGGVLCPVVGNVCMDMTMIDITDAPTAQEGDEVIIFGVQNPITDLARAIGTIPYEILTGIGARVKRVFFKEGN